MVHAMGQHEALSRGMSAGPFPKLGLIGPVWPFRGGVAQYNTRLRDSLFELVELTTVSFRRQYPGWLYPGVTDREIDNDSTDEHAPTINHLDYASPRSWRHAADMLLEAGCEVVIINWWTLFWAFPLTVIARRLRRRGVRVILLCHNLADHDASWLRQRLSNAMLRHADAYVVHSEAMSDELRAMMPGKPVMARILPIYDHYPMAIDVPPKRGRLELLFFGFIRPYKGLDDLLAALGRLQDQQVHLTVVGEPWGSERRLTHSVRDAGSPNVELVLNYVPSIEVAKYFARADLAVLPYRGATGSGVAALASHYRVPMLATRVNGLAESVIDGKTGYLVPAGDPDALADVIRRVDRESLRSMRPAIDAFCDENGWRAFSRTLVDFVCMLR